MVKGVGFRSLSFRGSWVQIPPSAPNYFLVVDDGKDPLYSSSTSKLGYTMHFSISVWFGLLTGCASCLKRMQPFKSDILTKDEKEFAIALLLEQIPILNYTSL